jgi:NADH:ubiquinone oxidoreductase subunit 6 (subunit J)
MRAEKALMLVNITLIMMAKKEELTTAWKNRGSPKISCSWLMLVAELSVKKAVYPIKNNGEKAPIKAKKIDIQEITEIH